MKVKLTVLQSSCRSGYHKNGDVFIVDDICPPICIELWNCLYPYLFAIKNGAELDAGEKKAKCFTARCPDGGRVIVKGEIYEESERS